MDRSSHPYNPDGNEQRLQSRIVPVSRSGGCWMASRSQRAKESVGSSSLTFKGVSATRLLARDTQPKMSHNNVLSHPRDSFSYGLAPCVVIEFLWAVTPVKRCYNCPVGCNIHNNKCYQNSDYLLSQIGGSSFENE